MRAKFRSKAGLGLVELIAMLAVVGLIMLVVLPYFARARIKGNHPRSLKCMNNLKNVGLAFRIYAADNNDLFPGQGLATNGPDLTSIKAVEIFRALSNELSTPKIVLCPSDNFVREATNWTDFDSNSFSFFASLSASGKTPDMFLVGDRYLALDGKSPGALLTLSSNAPPNISWTGDGHGHGRYHIAFADGHVEDLKSSRLKPAIRKQGAPTNLLAMPGY